MGSSGGGLARSDRTPMGTCRRGQLCVRGSREETPSGTLCFIWCQVLHTTDFALGLSVDQIVRQITSIPSSSNGLRLDLCGVGRGPHWRPSGVDCLLRTQFVWRRPLTIGRKHILGRINSDGRIGQHVYLDLDSKKSASKGTAGSGGFVFTTISSVGRSLLGTLWLVTWLGAVGGHPCVYRRGVQSVADVEYTRIKLLA